MKSKINFLNIRTVNKGMLVFLFAFSAAAIMSCGAKKEAEKIPGMIEVDLTSYGLPLTINIPDSSRGKMEIVSAPDGTVKIKVGKNFQLFLYEGAGDIALTKSDIAGDEVKKLQKYVIDEPATILYESQIPNSDPEFHLYTIVKAGEKSYVVEDIKEEILGEEAAKKILESAKSLKPKAAKAS
jgi:hypothetical protein